MNALDVLLSDAVSSMIRQKLGNPTCQKIEKRLLERYNLPLIEAIKDFTKFDATLREFFGSGADSIERDIIEKIFYFNNQKASWIMIENHDLSESILESYGNKEKKSILDVCVDNAFTISDILDKCNIPKSSGYRIIGDLVENGLLSEYGYSITADGKRVSLYTSLIDNVKIDIIKGNLSVNVQLKEDILKESNLVKILKGL